MQLSIEEVKKLDSNSYQIIDIRSEEEVAHGAIKGALNIQAEEIESDERVPHDKKLVIVCSRGKTSVDVAECLTEKGFDAVSLKGGYISWLLDAMKEDEVAERDIKADVEQSIRKKFKKSIWRKFTKAINTYELVKPGDKIAVCISGGKDSMLMAKLFQELKHHNKFDFDVKFLVMDPGYNEANRHVIEENCRNLGIPATIFESDIFDAVYDIEKSPCYLCARMRRGHLYAFAKELGCNKIALGHHYDDVIETILMGMLYGAQVQTMMPKLHSTNFEGMELIRPLYLVREDDIKAWRDYNGLHFIQCACKFTDTCTTCNNEENRSKRVEIKQLIANLKKVNPFVEANIFKSVENVNLATVVAYKKDGKLKHHNKFDFDVKFLVMDPGYNEANRHVIEENCRNLGIPATIFESDIFDAVYDIEKSPCYLCARMRRGHLYAFAKELGCNKIALGHHYDDVIETILMGMLYGAQVQTMMPKLHSTNFEGMELIRPLYLVREDDIKAWRDYNGLHFIQCACKFTDTCTTCNNEENRSKRVEIKQLIANLKKVNPFVEANIFKSVENVNLATVVAYKKDGIKHSFLDHYDE